MIFDNVGQASLATASIFSGIRRTTNRQSASSGRRRSLNLSRVATFVLLTAILVALAPSLALATSINYGNFPVPGTGVMFLNVTESSGTDAVPLYGPPVPFAVGLDFDPKSFVASGTGGGADITDGQLNFTVMGSVGPGGTGVGINDISLLEKGDYTLVGTGTPATQALAGAIISGKITEVDGVPLMSPVPFSNNGSVGFNLIANPGIVQPWSLGFGYPIAAALTANNIPFTIGATKVDITINNSLVAISEAASVAFIAKKDFVIGIIPKPHGSPEPSSLVLASLAAVALGWVVKAKRAA
jgi:hypothetical protein